jgi:hypothetical protein
VPADAHQASRDHNLSLQAFLDRLHNRLLARWLLKGAYVPREFIPRGTNSARGDKDDDARPAPLHLACKLQSVHSSGKLHVGKKHPHVRGVLKLLQELSGIRYFNNTVSSLTEVIGRDHPDECLVPRNENGRTWERLFDHTIPGPARPHRSGKTISKSQIIPDLPIGEQPSRDGEANHDPAKPTAKALLSALSNLTR